MLLIITQVKPFRSKLAKCEGCITMHVHYVIQNGTTGSLDDLTTRHTAHIENTVNGMHEQVRELSMVKNESLEAGRAYADVYIVYNHTLEGIHSILEHGSSAHSGHHD